MNARQLVLASMASAGPDARFSPAQIQKMMFLIDREIPGDIGGPIFSHVAYDYGPFDKTIYSVLADMQHEGLATIEHNGRYREYSLTQEGVMQGAEELKGISDRAQRYFREVANWVRSVPFRTLVSAIYDKYPEMKANSIFKG